MGVLKNMPLQTEQMWKLMGGFNSVIGSFKEWEEILVDFSIAIELEKNKSVSLVDFRTT